MYVYDKCYSGNECLDDPNRVATISRQSWDALEETDRRTLLADCSVHVVGASPHQVFSKFKDWKDFCTTRININSDRHVHDQVASSDIQGRMRRGNIDHFLKSIASGSNQVVNYLDIDMSGLRDSLPYDGLEDGENLSSTTQRSVVWHTHWPTRHLSWGLLGKKSSITRSHVDAAGFCTRVRVIKGKKLWLMALDQKLPTAQGLTNKVKWQAVILSEGDSDDL
jgi:hypothetical protein